MDGAINNVIVIDNEISIIETDNKIKIVNNNIIVSQPTSLKVVYKSIPDCKNLVFTVASDLDLYEFYEFEGDSNIENEYQIEPQANVNRYVENRTSEKFALNIEETVNVKDALIRSAYLDLGATNCENKISYNLLTPGGEAHVHLGVLSSNSKKKYDIALNHLNHHTYGNMDNYGIVKNAGSLIINGIGKIAKGCSKSNTHQINKIIVFDKKCQAQANPYLLVDEYDVNASHGASVGKIDDQQLFYLQSRGLTSQQAMSLVTIGYFMPVINYIKNEKIKEDVGELLNEKVVG